MKTSETYWSLNPDDPADYKFSESGVPVNEAESCLYYEFARESESIIRAAKSVRRQLVAGAKRRNQPIRIFPGFEFSMKKFMTRPGILFESILCLRLAAMEKFPTVPWQRLSREDKHKLRGFVANARKAGQGPWDSQFPALKVEIPSDNGREAGDVTLNAWTAKQTAGWVRVPFPEANKKLLELGAPPDFMRFQIVNPVNTVAGFFRANLNYPPDTLRRAFNDWLKTVHPDMNRKMEKIKGRHSPYDKLEALGAMRLRCCCPDYAATRFCGKAYARKQFFDRACERALVHFHALLNLPASERPIHYTKNFRVS